MNPNPWSCMGIAFSRAIGIDFAQFVFCVGHDGGGAKHLGFHPQECIDVALRYGFSCTPIQLYVGLLYDDGTAIIWSKEESWKRFETYALNTKRGVFEGIRIKQNGKQIGHAVVILDGIIYDGLYTYPFSDCSKYNFQPQTLWILNSMEDMNEQNEMVLRCVRPIIEPVTRLQEVSI